MYTERAHSSSRRRRHVASSYNPFDAERRASPEAQAGVGAFMGTVFAWMAGGLTLSAAVAYWLSTQPELLASLFTGVTGWLLLLTPFALIFVLAFRMEKASLGESAFWYLLMTGIMGSWLTGIAVQANEDPAFASAVYQTLGITVAMFGGMSLTGWITRRDLTAMGNFFVAALWGFIAVGVVNFYFVQSAGLDFLYHLGGVILFAGLTAYDTQKIKSYYYTHGAHHGLAIWGALSLYLDFVNLFLHLLRFMGASSASKD